MSDATTYDAFVCHASEDKLRFVEPLLRELDGRVVKFWYDRVEIKLGDNIAARINDGLARARFGVVVLSPRFWSPPERLAGAQRAVAATLPVEVWSAFASWGDAACGE